MGRNQRDEPTVAAMTAQLTTITHVAPSTPDYTIADLEDDDSEFGFSTKDEGNTVLSVIANLQARLAEVEAALESAKIVPDN